MGFDSVRSIAYRLSLEHAEPRTLAAAVLEELGFEPERLREALREVLPTFVAGIKRNSRNITMSEAGKDREVSKPRGKVVAMRSWHQRWLDESLHTAEGWKRIRETTQQDWIFAAQERANHIASEHVRMSQCREMAELFRIHKVTLAVDLPESEVQAIFERAA